MHLNSLRVFVAVHDYGSFQKAADSRGVSQSAVTKTIRKLEEHYGVLLIERGSKATLTLAGRALYDGAVQLLNLAAAIDKDVLIEKTALTGTIRVGSVSPLVQPILLPAVAHTLRQHPAARLNLVRKLSSSLLSMLADGKLDLAIAFDVKSIPSEVVSTTLGAQQYYLVTHKDGPYAGRSVTMQELAQAQWLLPFKDIALRRALEQPFTDAGYGSLDVRVETDIDTFQASPLVCNTKLIAIMAAQSFRISMEPELTTIQTSMPIPVSRVVLYQRRRTPSTGLFAEMKNTLTNKATKYFQT